jgi:hypothetical protein
MSLESIREDPIMICALRTVACLACTAWLVGCAHYVNIPSQQGDMAYHDPNAKAPRAVMQAALQKALELRPMDAPFQVMLPIGTVPTTYATMLARVSAHAMWSSDGRSKDLPIVRVDQVRIRGRQAEVDIVMPIYPGDTAAVAQMITVVLRLEAMSKWYVVRVNEWRRSARRSPEPGVWTPESRSGEMPPLQPRQQ